MPYEQATERELRAHIRANPGGLAPRRRLAEMLEARGDLAAAAVEYLAIADAFVGNDLLTKAIDTLDRVAALDPGRKEVGLRKAKLEGLENTLPRRDLQIARLARRPRETVEPQSLTAYDLRRFWIEIGSSPLVEELDDDARALLFAASEVQQWTAMSSVVREQQWLPRCYLVTEGALAATVRTGRARPRTLRRLIPGEVVGDRALLEDTPWTVGYRTECATAALRISARRFVEGVPETTAPRR